MPKLSIVIPCYNEEKNIPLLLEKFATVTQGRDIEIVLVQNGSVDNSAAIINELLPNYPGVRCVTVEKNIGYGFGVLTGLMAASGEFLGSTHADLQTDPSDVVKAYDMIMQAEHPEKLFIKGNRYGRSAFDTFFTIGMSAFELLCMQKILWDINAQPTIFHRSFFEKLSSPPYDFSFDLYLLYMAKRLGLTIKRFGVYFGARQHGVSSWNNGLAGKWKLIKRTMSFSLSLRSNLSKHQH